MNLFENEHKTNPKGLGTIFYCFFVGFDICCIHKYFDLEKIHIFDIHIRGDQEVTGFDLDFHHGNYENLSP